MEAGCQDLVNDPQRAGGTRDSQCTYRMMMGDLGRPYVFTPAARLLEGFWREVKRDPDERGIPMTYKNGTLAEFKA